MKGWLDVCLKELREFARDKRVFYNAVLGPLLLEVFLILLFGYLESNLSKSGAQKISIVNAEEGGAVLDALYKKQNLEIKPLSKEANIQKELFEKKAQVVIEFPEGFAKKVSQRQAPEFYAYLDPLDPRSKIAFEIVKNAVDEASAEYAKARMQALGLDEKEFLPFILKEEKAKTGKPFAGEWLVAFLPYLIVIWAFYGGFAIVSDLVAGEKERGSLETLLISPISRRAIAFGKFCALAIVSFVSTLSALAGVLVMGFLNLPITRKLFEEGLTMTPLSIITLVITVLPLVVFFSGILLAVSTFSRNQKEVQSYLSLLGFVVLVPAIASQFVGFTDIASAKWLPFIPILNSAMVMRDALLNKVDMYSLFITTGISVTLAGAGLWFAVRLFLKETVLLRV